MRGLCPFVASPLKAYPIWMPVVCLISIWAEISFQRVSGSKVDYEIQEQVVTGDKRLLLYEWCRSWSV